MSGAVDWICTSARSPPVVSCPGPGGQPTKEMRTFGTMTADLLALGDWLADGGVTHVAMESTGVYWKPLWNLFEERFTLLLVNAAHVKVVPGRKRDVGDARGWPSCCATACCTPSFVPDRPARELRELTRYRSSLGAGAHRRGQPPPEDAWKAPISSLPVWSVMSPASRPARCSASWWPGPRTPAPWRSWRRASCGASGQKLEQALTGRMSAHQRFMLVQHLTLIDALDAQIAAMGAEIAERLRPFEAELSILDSIPGIGRWSAEVILAEIGTDMSRFPTAGHLASWAGMCPGHDESAGKQRSGKTRKGSPWLRVTLTEAAYAAGRGKETYLSAPLPSPDRSQGQEEDPPSPCGRTILELCHQLLSSGQLYDDQRARAHLTPVPLTQEQRLVRQLEKLGHRVTLEPAA